MDGLRDTFARYLDAEARQGNVDVRDTMVGLAPFIDCARRLGHDPIDTLGPIAAITQPWLRDLFEVFVRRDDVTLEAFGWELGASPDGPRYTAT